MADGEEVLYFESRNLEDIITPVRVNKLEQMLTESGYNPGKRQFLVNGFRNGFDLGYQGPENICQKAPNLKFTVRNKTILWYKVMKAVEAK